MNQIPYEERVEIYKEAAETFGISNQLVVAMEELSEVQKELCKAMRGEADIYHIAEEVADATIMLEQVRQIFSINNEVCKIMDAKVSRLYQRVEDEKARRQSRRELIRKTFTKVFGTKKEAESND
jgi:hypothetical protein